MSVSLQWWKQVCFLACLSLLVSCAVEPSESEQRAGRETRKFSDDRFLCDADNLALWSQLEAEGVDVRGMGLTCTRDENGNAIRVSDSFLPADGESADATAGTGGSPDAGGDDTGAEDDMSGTTDAGDTVDDMANTPDDAGDEAPPEDTPPDDTPAVTFSANLAPLINADCVGCHSGQFPPRLDGYTNAANAGQASLDAVLTNAMPLGNANNWSPTEKELFQAWADAGFPE